MLRAKHDLYDICFQELVSTTNATNPGLRSDKYSRQICMVGGIRTHYYRHGAVTSVCLPRSGVRTVD